MPSTRRRRTRDRMGVGELADAAYTFFGDGPFFAGEDYEQESTAEERRALWRRHRQDIVDRWYRENPQHHDLKTWGEYLEAREAARHA